MAALRIITIDVVLHVPGRWAAGQQRRHVRTETVVVQVGIPGQQVAIIRRAVAVVVQAIGRAAGVGHRGVHVRVRIVAVATHLHEAAHGRRAEQLFRGGVAKAVVVRIGKPPEVLIHLAVAVVVQPVAQFHQLTRGTEEARGRLEELIEVPLRRGEGDHRKGGQRYIAGAYHHAEASVRLTEAEQGGRHAIGRGISDGQRTIVQHGAAQRHGHVHRAAETQCVGKDRDLREVARAATAIIAGGLCIVIHGGGVGAALRHRADLEVQHTVHDTARGDGAAQHRRGEGAIERRCGPVHHRGAEAALRHAEGDQLTAALRKGVALPIHQRVLCSGTGGGVQGHAHFRAGRTLARQRLVGRVHVQLAAGDGDGAAAGEGRHAVQDGLLHLQGCGLRVAHRRLGEGDAVVGIEQGDGTGHVRDGEGVAVHRGVAPTDGGGRDVQPRSQQVHRVVAHGEGHLVQLTIAGHHDVVRVRAGAREVGHHIDVRTVVRAAGHQQHPRRTELIEDRLAETAVHASDSPRMRSGPRSAAPAHRCSG